jgi:hypothetical protein
VAHELPIARPALTLSCSQRLSVSLSGDAGTMRAITYQRYTRFLHIAKHGGKTGKGLRSSHGFFPSEVSNNMRSVRPRSLLRDLGRMSR